MVAQDELLTVQQVAERFKVHVNTVRRWLGEGQLKGAKLGGDKTGWRVRASEVERFFRDAEQRAS